MTRTKYFAEVESSARRKIASRLLPYLFFLYLISYLDRMNISAAALQLPADLGFSDHVIGLGAGIFFVGYLLLDLPGALIVERWGARAWIARIMISWGVITVLSAFIQTANQFFTARFLLGVAEAGFVPGIMVHLTHWFVDQDRGKAVARFMAASPVAYVIGSPLAGLILMTRWWGWHGWQWLFVLEGIPAIVLGVVTAFFLTDWPDQAHWLSPKEQEWIRGALDSEKSARAARASFTVVKALRDPDVILMAVSGFFVNVGIIGFGFWLPTMVKRFSGLSDFWSASLAALPYVAAFFAMHLSGSLSDRSGERRWHTIVPRLIAALPFVLISLRSFSPVAMLGLFTLAGASLYAIHAPIWALIMAHSNRFPGAAAVGIINTVSIVGGFAGPYLMGYLQTRTHSFQASLLFLAASLVVSAVLVIPVRDPRGSPSPGGSLQA